MNKLINKPLMGLLASALLLAACKKSNNGSGGAVSASFSSGSFSAQSYQAYYSKSQATFLIGGYTVTNGDSSIMELQLSSAVTLNTPVTFAAGQYVTYFDTKNNFYFTGDATDGHGTVTITSWDTTNLKVSGTFTGVLPDNNSATDSLVVKTGQFNVTYVLAP